MERRQASTTQTGGRCGGQGPSVENAAGWMEGGSECEGEVAARLRGRARADDAGYTNWKLRGR